MGHVVLMTGIYYLGVFFSKGNVMGILKYACRDFIEK
jgi:hypothetical protein